MSEIAHFITLMFVMSIAIERMFEFVKIILNLDRLLRNSTIRRLVYQTVPVVIGFVAAKFGHMSVPMVSEVFTPTYAAIVIALLVGGGSSYWYNFHRNAQTEKNS